MSRESTSGPDALDNLPKTAENEKFIAAVRPAFEKYKSIGVRIEDDMLITRDGVKWMTRSAAAKDVGDRRLHRARRAGKLKTAKITRLFRTSVQSEDVFVATLRTTSGLFEKSRASAAAHQRQSLLQLPSAVKNCDAIIFAVP